MRSPSISTTTSTAGASASPTRAPRARAAAEARSPCEPACRATTYEIEKSASVCRGAFHWLFGGHLAQWLEHLAYTEGVGGSKPSVPNVANDLCLAPLV